MWGRGRNGERREIVKTEGRGGERKTRTEGESKDTGEEGGGGREGERERDVGEREKAERRG